MARTLHLRLALSCLLVAGAARVMADTGVRSIPFDQLGAELQKLHAGDASSIHVTANGIGLNAATQDLEGEVTAEGLWLRSTADEDLGKPNRLRVRAMRVGDRSTGLAATGTVRATRDSVSYVRPGLVEEFSVSTDGVRQDFLVLQRPRGDGRLSVGLEVTGAHAQAAAYGVKLVVDGTGRELAYSRLKVTDAAGRELSARMDVDSANQLRVTVDDADAVYPVRIDPTFSDADWVSVGGVPGANGVVNAIAADAAGNIYVGGAFTVVGDALASFIAKWNGSSWSALGSGMNSSVNALLVVGPDLYAGGAFTTAGGVTVNRIAKWNGTTWSALGTGMNGLVETLVGSGTDIYAGGSFTTANGVTANRVAKWNGTTWSTLGTGLGFTVFAMGVSGTDVYVAGSFVGAGAVTANRVAKWDGTTWSALGQGVNNTVNALVVSGSDIYVGGTFTTADGAPANRVAKWNGTAWSALGAGVDNAVNALALAGGNLYAGGNFTTADGAPATSIARWDGTAWSAVGTGASGGGIEALAVVGSDVYAGGNFTSAGDSIGTRVAKWNGSVWCSLGGGGMNGNVNAFVVHGSDVYVGGAFTVAGGVRANRLVQWNGSTWTPLGTGMDNTVSALAFSGADLYAGGSFTTAGGVSANRIAKWNGTVWSPLGSGLDGAVSALAVSGTDVYVGGSFLNAGGSAANRVAKWNGTAWTPLGAGMDGSVSALAVSGTDVYAGGSFLNAGGSSASRIAKWNGTAWSVLGSGLNSSVTALVVSGTDLYAAGGFVTAGGVSANRIAKWNGSAWSALGAGLNNNANALAFWAGELVAGGTFTSAGSTAANSIAKWDGATWAAMGSGANGPVTSLAVTNGELLVGGSFTTAGGMVSAFLSRVKGPVPVLALQSVSLVGSSAATLNGTVNPKGFTTTAQMEYGLDTNYGSAVSVTLAPANGVTAQSVATGLSGLAPKTLYHYRLTAANIYGTVSTADGTFTTLSNNADLAALAPSAGALNPAFDTNVSAYTVDVVNQVKSFSVTPTTADAGATVKVNGVTVASGSASTPANLVVGSTTFTVQVTAEDGVAVKTYTVVVTRPPSSNADLASLAPSDGLLSPAFASGTFVYQADVPNETKALTVTPTVADSTASVKVNHVALASGSASAPISLVVGPNTINTVVTAEDGVTVKTYTVVVTRAPSSNANLAGIALSDGVLNPGFASDTVSYGVNVPNETTSITLAPTVADATASVKVNGVPVASGSASAPISLVVGPNTITTVVTAEDGVTLKAYVVVVSRALSSNANLTGIALSTGVLSPAFSSATTSYDVTVPIGTTQITVAPTVADSTATVKVNGITVVSGAASGVILLNKVGATVINVAVTAQDGTLKTYVITVKGPPQHGELAINFPPGSTLEMNTRSGTVYIPIIRTGGTDGTVGFTLDVHGGGPPGKGGAPRTFVQSMGDGVNALTVALPISPAKDKGEGENFVVILSKPTGGATLGEVKTVHVRFVDKDDKTAPSVPVITSPSPNAALDLASADPLTVSGTAGDNNSVVAVKVKLNSGAWVDAVLTSHGASATRFTASVTGAVTGTNTLSVQSTDSLGLLSGLVTRTFVVTTSLVVHVDTELGSVTHGFAGSSSRQVGQRYTITATPKNGYVFDGWTANDSAGAGIEQDALRLKTLSFTMVARLELTARFVANPFSRLAGSYNGLVLPSGATLPGLNANGLVSLQVSATGAFSGKLTLDGSMLPVSGSFDSAGVARFGATLTAAASLTRTGRPTVDLVMQLDMSDTTKCVLGTTVARDRTTSAVLATSGFSADRAVFALPDKVVDVYYTPAGPAHMAMGCYTVALPAAPQATALDGTTPLDAAAFPQGTGCANVTLSAKGTVFLVGTLADGTVVAASAPLSKDYGWPFFSQLYGMKGAIGGSIQFDRSQPDSDLSKMGCFWFRPALAERQWYPAGWPGGIAVDMVGARYQVTAGSSVLPGLVQPADTTDGNADLDFGEGSLAALVHRTVGISTNDLVTRIPADTTFSCAITRSSGAFYGMFTHTDGTRPLYRGVILQKGASAGGWGYFRTLAPASVDGLGQSGVVTLLAQP